jgi:hypothetical protein
MPGGQISKPQISNSNPDKTFDAVSDGLQHATNLPIYSLPQDNAKTRRRQGAKPGKLRVPAIEKNSAPQLRSERWIPRPIQHDLILFVQVETGVGKPLRQFTIVSQKE